MSLKYFFNKIWKNLNLVFYRFPTNFKNAVHIGVVVTENIKNFIDSPVADALTAIIPGSVDDEIKRILRAKIPVILNNLRLIDAAEHSNSQDITKQAIKVLQKLDPEIKINFLHSLSILITQAACDGKISWSDGVCIVEWYYKYKFKSLIN
jgi:hypothetical protein